MSFVKKALGQICTIQIGKTPSRHENDFWRDGTHAWLSIADMNQGRYLINTKECITDLGVKTSNIKLIPVNTLVLSYKLSIGKVGITQKPMYTNEAIASLTNLDVNVDLNYLYWALQHIDLLENADRAAMGKTLNKAKLKEVKIPLPSLPEQRRIAAILDQADELWQKRQQAIKKLDQLLQATFIDMFGDPVSNPKGWGKEELQNICKQVIDCPHSTPTWSDEGIICLRTSNLGKGEWIWEDTRYVSPLEYKERTKRSEIFAGDIILSREGTVGIAAIVPKDLKLSLGQRLVQLTPELEKINSEFLLQVLLYDLDPIRISSLMVGSTSKHINVKDLRRLKLFVPPLELQNKFSVISSIISRQKKELKTCLSNFEDLFKSLQNQAFSGQL